MTDREKAELRTLIFKASEIQALADLLVVVNQLENHYATIKTDYGFACKYCSDKAPELVFIMSPCLESENLLKMMYELSN
jgi:hypothetical protein